MTNDEPTLSELPNDDNLALIAAGKGSYFQCTRLMAAEILRLRKLIQDTAKHWMSIEGIPFEGGVDGAMLAAVREIRRLRSRNCALAATEAWAIKLATDAQADVEKVTELYKSLVGKLTKDDATCAHKPESHRDDFGKAPNYGGIGPGRCQDGRAEASLATGGVVHAHKTDWWKRASSVTPLDLGEAFRQQMNAATVYRDMGDRIHALHRAVAELAKVIERIGAR